VGRMRGKYIEKIRDYLKRTPVASVDSISALAPDRNYAHVIVNHLIKRGELRRITRSYYTIHEDPSLLVYCLRPAYIGLQDAMSFHDIWEQETNPVIITTRKVRPGVREVLGQNVWVRRISPEHFFGYDYIASGEFLLPVSDLEKTLIDMVYFRQMKRDIVKEFRKRIDREKLERYLKKYGSSFRRKVIEILQ
jgi:predicted transcriptional regulator of viral defense system